VPKFTHANIFLNCLRLWSRDVHQTQIWVVLKNVWEPPEGSYGMTSANY